MAMVPPLFGLKAIGALLGLATFAWAAGDIAGPLMAGYVYDVSHSYDLDFVSDGILLVLGAFAV